jgi:hypothetical protein
MAALCETAITVHCVRERASEADLEAVSVFVLAQQQRMPDWSRPPIAMLMLVFTCQSVVTSGRFFHQRPLDAATRQFLAWRNSRLAARRNFVRLFESLAVFGWFSFFADRSPA